MSDEAIWGLGIAAALARLAMTVLGIAAALARLAMTGGRLAMTAAPSQ